MALPPGTGTNIDPYRVSTAIELYDLLSYNSTAFNYITIMNDIDMSSLGTLLTFPSVLNVFSVAGNGYSIKNLTFSNPSANFSLFPVRNVSNNINITDLTIDNFKITAQSGSFFKGSSGLIGTFHNCHIKNSSYIATSSLGAFAMTNTSSASIIQYCSCTNTTLSSIGSSVGFLSNGYVSTISNSYFKDCKISAPGHIGFIGDKTGTTTCTVRNSYIHGELYFTTPYSNTTNFYLCSNNSSTSNTTYVNCVIVPTKMSVAPQYIGIVGNICVFTQNSGFNSSCRFVEVPIVSGVIT